MVLYTRIRFHINHKKKTTSMNRDYYNKLADAGLNNNPIERALAKEILTSDKIEIMPLLNAAFEVRKHFRGLDVTIHIINNDANGRCQEDCNYCAQAKTSESGIEEYPIKTTAEFMAEARNAYEKGAHRYCMVFSGRGPSQSRTEKLADLIKKIKDKYPIEVCVSAGLMDENKAKTLKEAGLDRLNHNLNTSSAHYPNICQSHTYEDRLNTLKAAKKVGLEVCSGMIVGMQEGIDDILDCVYELTALEAKSIPVNFFMPIKGNKLYETPNLSPNLCLRILALFRFLNPKVEIRAAAGREMHLRDMEVLAFYAADSLFLDGYLNTKGNTRHKTLQMLQDAGFSIKSDYDISELLEKEEAVSEKTSEIANNIIMKDLADLRPTVEIYPSTK
ncbi:MAG: biotin synthase [Candidatus Omnitrophota bacterium]|jgi:biotin synthase